MQVNAVHSLLALLRQQRQAPELNPGSATKVDAVADLIAATKATNMRLAMLEQLLREQHVSVQDVVEKPQVAGSEGAAKKLFVKLASATSDAINQNQHERHGRSWFQSSRKTDTPAQFHERAEENESISKANNYFDGIALPYRPSRDDIESALQNGIKAQPELAILVRRLDFSEPKGSVETAENGINFFFFLIGAAMAVFLLFMFR